jgi:hypothetical protein
MHLLLLNSVVNHPECQIHKGMIFGQWYSRVVFATDYPQEIRKREVVRDFVKEIRALGPDGERILSGNVALLLKEPLHA